MNFKKVKQINQNNLNGVNVVDGDLNSALRTFKRIIKDNNIIQECFDRKYYKKPSVTKKEILDTAKYNQTKETDE